MSALSLVSLFLLPVQGAAQAFDCSKAGNSTEKEICINAELGALDNGMADAYKAAESKAAGDQERQLRSDQRAWLERRNDCQGDGGCITKTYLARLRTLTNDYDIFGVWAGTYDGPYDELELDISGSEASTISVTFVGGGASYTCGPVTGAGKIDKSGLIVTDAGDEIMVLHRMGTGIYLPQNSVNTNLGRANCGMNAPELSGSYYRRQ
ncbi:lysozyme inhibitor LprI family protein [Ruegeria hyattellae]|uniref:lysozyme inhibitor LprI family protein n=1 Tax=Ruegeria hyattellae TaxID=3233337 RepID=UPI00355B45F2